jgi:predicted PurR-regulated permease PerM
LKKIRFRKFYIPSWLRALITLLVFFFSLFFIVMLFAPLVEDEIAILSSIDASQVASKIDEQFNLAGYAPAFLEGQTLTEYLVTSAQELLSFNWIEQIFTSIFGVLGQFVIGVFAVLFISFFFIKDGFLFTRIVFTLTPDRSLGKMKNIVDHSYKLLKRFFVGLFIQSVVMSMIVGVSLYFLGVKNALLIGLFAGIVNVIPYIGPWLAALFGALVALTTSLHLDFDTALLPLLIKVVLVFVVAQQIDGFVVQPLVLGNSVKAHPLEIFIVVLAAGTIGGITGMIVAIPVYTLLRIIAKEFLSEFKVVDSLTRELTQD